MAPVAFVAADWQVPLPDPPFEPSRRLAEGQEDRDDDDDREENSEQHVAQERNTWRHQTQERPVRGHPRDVNGKQRGDESDGGAAVARRP